MTQFKKGDKVRKKTFLYKLTTGFLIWIIAQLMFYGAIAMDERSEACFGVDIGYKAEPGPTVIGAILPLVIFLNENTDFSYCNKS